MKQTFFVNASRPQTKKKRKGKSKLMDSVDVQFSITVEIPRGKILAPAVIEEAIRYKAATGNDPKGFTIKLIQWRNPDRKRGRTDDVYTSKSQVNGGRGWRSYGTQRERWDTLGRAIRGPLIEFTVASGGSGEGKK